MWQGGCRALRWGKIPSRLMQKWIWRLRSSKHSEGRPQIFVLGLELGLCVSFIDAKTRGPTLTFFEASSQNFCGLGAAIGAGLVFDLVFFKLLRPLHSPLHCGHRSA